MTGRLSQKHVPWNNGREGSAFKKLSDLVNDIMGKIQLLREHGQKQALYLQTRICIILYFFN
mgnify:CR=1 FL=1